MTGEDEEQAGLGGGLETSVGLVGSSAVTWCHPIRRELKSTHFCQAFLQKQRWRLEVGCLAQPWW